MENEVRPIDANALSRKIREYMDDFPHATACLTACRAVLSMLRDEAQTPTIHPTPAGYPLMLEQLRGMDGKAAFSPEINCCVLITKNPFTTLLTFMDGEQCSASDWYEEVGPVYSYHPSHIDREAWEPCEVCGGKKTLYQQTNSTKLFMNTFGKAATLVTECMACPPYADCCMKDVSANSAFKIHFCPKCGRPLTPESWAELEKRLRG